MKKRGNKVGNKFKEIRATKGVRLAVKFKYIKSSKVLEAEKNVSQMLQDQRFSSDLRTKVGKTNR